MAAKFVILDRDTPMMLPPDLRDWISEDSMVHFIVDAVEALEIKGFGINERGSGSAQYPPQMMLSLLIYCYATKRFSSREIERATYTDIAVRYICGGDLHPDHDTICAFRLKNREAFKEVFTKVLLLGVELGHLKKIGGISIDGTKIKANASKHAAVSYKRAGEMRMTGWYYRMRSNGGKIGKRRWSVHAGPWKNAMRRRGGKKNGSMRQKKRSGRLSARREKSPVARIHSRRLKRRRMTCSITLPMRKAES